MPKLILINLQHQLVQCSTLQCQKNKKIVVYQLVIPFTNDQKQPLSRVNLTGRPVGWILLRGALLCFGRYFLAPEALTRAPRARASRGVWGHAPHEILQI